MFKLLTGSGLRRPAVYAPVRQFSMLGAPSVMRPKIAAFQPVPTSPMQMLFGLIQRRFKSRGNTYQPSTLKRKRTFGFLAKLRTKNGRKVLQKRKAKGRWYLTH